jgi:hypothetical protein
MAHPVEAAVDDGHRDGLELLLSGFQLAVRLDNRCDYGDPFGDRPQNRTIFAAHFRELDGPLEAWNAAVERVRSASDALWAWFGQQASERGIAEPVYAVGPLVDRLATQTLERSRRGGAVGPSDALASRHFTDAFGEDRNVSIYLEGQKVATVPGSPEADLRRRLAEADRQIQTLFEDGQASGAADEVGEAREALLALKQPLLGRLECQLAIAPVTFAPDCPVCRAVV